MTSCRMRSSGFWTITAMTEAPFQDTPGMFGIRPMVWALCGIAALVAIASWFYGNTELWSGAPRLDDRYTLFTEVRSAAR
jgi:hypothetical protein